jgi:hypothetical protein
MLFALVFLVSASAWATRCEHCDRDVRGNVTVHSGSSAELGIGVVPVFSLISHGDRDDWDSSGFDEDNRLAHFGREKRPEPFWGRKGPKVGIEGATVLHSNKDIDDEDPPTVPEPATLSLLATGLLGLAGVVRYRVLR